MYVLTYSLGGVVEGAHPRNPPRTSNPPKHNKVTRSRRSKKPNPTMSLAALARGCAIHGSNGLRKMRFLPAAAPRRLMGGGGGHQPISRSMEAELFQGHPKEPEGWETTIYLTYGSTVVLLAFALGFAPDTSIKTVSFRLYSPRPPPALLTLPTLKHSCVSPPPRSFRLYSFAYSGHPVKRVPVWHCRRKANWTNPCLVCTMTHPRISLISRV